MADDKRVPIKPLEPDQWAQDLQNICADINGLPINVHKLMAHSPGLLQACPGFEFGAMDYIFIQQKYSIPES